MTTGRYLWAQHWPGVRHQTSLQCAVFPWLSISWPGWKMNLNSIKDDTKHSWPVTLLCHHHHHHHHHHHRHQWKWKYFEHAESEISTKLNSSAKYLFSGEEHWDDLPGMMKDVSILSSSEHHSWGSGVRKLWNLSSYTMYCGQEQLDSVIMLALLCGFNPNFYGCSRWQKPPLFQWMSHFTSQSTHVKHVHHHDHDHHVIIASIGNCELTENCLVDKDDGCRHWPTHLDHETMWWGWREEIDDRWC